MSEKSSIRSETFVKILIPVSKFVDRARLTRALHAVSVFQNPLVVLFHVIEVKSRTVPVDPSPFKEEIAAAEAKLKPTVDWLKEQGYKTTARIVLARDAIEGIITEANSGDYTVILMMKRRIRRGISKLFQKSTSEAVIRSAKPIVLTMLASEI